MAGSAMVSMFGKTFPNVYIAYVGLGVIAYGILPTTPTQIRNTFFPSKAYKQSLRDAKVDASLDYGKDDKEVEFVKKYVAEHYKH
ncbi:uncharacterized protein HGUI_02490 [Hanseniaspora guilliermondii]|uniref:Uncharacterized protein n=1 Tax=Hanseniaspora guilliermondii TaxID=56406 RepID=A0A1L0B1K1_9ASCO|nr:uncharacterized protein HGUI_02490 [Hanseniaspora guilliermondii]